MFNNLYALSWILLETEWKCFKMVVLTVTLLVWNK